MSSWPGQGQPPSPPYRQKRYSPSRMVSPPPTTTSSQPPAQARRDDIARPMRAEHYSPPRGGGDRYAPRSRSPTPPRYRDRDRERVRRSPSPRYRDSDRYRASPPPPPPPGARRNRPGAADFYTEPPMPPPRRDRDRFDDERPGRAMAADYEEDRVREIPPPRRERVQDQWQRGYEPGHDDSGYGYGGGDRYEEDDRRQDDRTAKRGGRGPSAPYRDVIFLGLDDELTEADFSGFLASEHQAQLSSVKIVRDRETGRSRNFGFAQFATLDDAQEFVYNNYPYVQMPALYAHSEARRVKIDFSAPAPGHGAEPHRSADLPPARRHDGTQDMGSAGNGNRVLLLRMLDWNTRGEDIIFRLSQEITRMLGKQGRERDAEPAIVRVATIHDMVGRNASWGFAFVELVTAELATALLSFLISRDTQPQGFCIADRPIGASFASAAAFMPFPAGPQGGPFLLRASRNGGIGSDTIDQPGGQWVGYAHDQAGAIEAVPQAALPINEDGTLPTVSHELRSLLGGLAGRLPGTAEASSSTTAPPTAGIVNISNVMQPIKIGAPIAMPKTARKAEEAGFVSQDRRNILDDDEEEQDLVGKDTVLLSRTKGAHIVPPTSGSRKTAKNISKWNTKQSELAAPVPAPMAGSSGGAGPPKGISSANATLGFQQPKNPARNSAAAQASHSASPSPGPAAPATASPTAVADEFDYSGTVQADGKIACLLCQRLLPNADTLRKHTATSNLHKTNLANPETVAGGRQRKQNAGPANASAEDAPKYRDRAAERREVFHQPEKPSYMDRQALSKSASSSTGPPKRKFAEGPKAPSPPPEPGLAPAQDEANKGNALLTKMGWAAGTGLGLGSEGRVEPIEVKQLQERAGLGAGKSCLLPGTSASSEIRRLSRPNPMEMPTSLDGVDRRHVVLPVKRVFLLAVPVMPLAFRVAESVLSTEAPPIPRAQAWATTYTSKASAGSPPLINMAQGVPGDPPAPRLLEAMARTASDPSSAGYGPILGEDALRQALANELNLLYRCAPQRLLCADQVCITTGCNMAFLVIAMVLCPPGSKALVPLPAYFSHSMSLSIQSIEPIYIPCSHSEGFRPSLSAARASLESDAREGQRTMSMIVLVTPSNPTGAVYSPDELRKWYDLAKEFQVALVLDETYRDFVDGERSSPHDLFELDDWQDTLISISSMSKGYRIPGHRLGSIVASPELLDSIAIVCDCMQICAPRPPQLALASRLPELRADLDASAAALDRRLSLFCDIIGRLPGWSVSSRGGYYVYVRYPEIFHSGCHSILGVPADATVGSEAVARFMAEQFGVICLPGSFFMPDLHSAAWRDIDAAGGGELKADRWLRFAIANVSDEAVELLEVRLVQVNAILRTHSARGSASA